MCCLPLFGLVFISKLYLLLLPVVVRMSPVLEYGTVMPDKTTPPDTRDEMCTKDMINEC